MKYLSILVAFLLCSLGFGQSDIKKDIDDKYLDELYIERDSTLKTEFQRFAIDLFKHGQNVNDSILKRLSYKVGITLINKEESSSREDLEFTLYTLSYKDLREKNFHKSIYFGRGREGLSNFYVGFDTEEQKRLIDDAVLAYLKFDSIPTSNEAYKFANTYLIDDKHYDKYFSTDGYSTLIVGGSYGYLRQNGDYLVQIEGYPDKTLNEDTEKLYVTDYFVNNWYAISVFIIDDSSGKAYNKIFEHN